ASAAVAVAEQDAARPGDHLPEVPAEGAGQALRLGGGTGRGPWTVSARRADRGATGGTTGASLALVQAQPRAGSSAGGGAAGVRDRGDRLDRPGAGGDRGARSSGTGSGERKEGEGGCRGERGQGGGGWQQAG